MSTRVERIQRTDRIVRRRRAILRQYGGEQNLLWNRVRKHNLVCLCPVCQINRELLGKDRSNRRVAGKTLADEIAAWNE